MGHPGRQYTLRQPLRDCPSHDARHSDPGTPRTSAGDGWTLGTDPIPGLKSAPSEDLLARRCEPGGERVLTVEDRAEVRRLHRAEGMPVKAIARVMGISRNTVRVALASDGPPKCQRAAAG